MKLPIRLIRLANEIMHADDPTFPPAGEGHPEHDNPKALIELMIPAIVILVFAAWVCARLFLR